MDISKLKNLIKSSGDKFILLDVHGEPELVILSFAEYERLLGGRGQKGLTEGVEASPKYEDRGSEFNDFEPFSWGESVGLPIRLEDVRLEDLPI